METLGNDLEINGNEKVAIKSSKIFSCEKCDYNTCKKSNFECHLKTIQHLQLEQAKKVAKVAKKVAKVAKKVAKVAKVNSYSCCSCGKSYMSYSGLWKHQKKCVEEEEPQEVVCITPEEDTTNKELVITLLKQQNEQAKQQNEQTKQMTSLCEAVVEICKNGIINNSTNTNNNNNTNTNNSHNKTFNLQFFLNETCKDAMNLTEFVDSINLKLSDLEYLGDNGFVEGITKVINRKLNSLDENKRPIHCTDLKREVLYVKEDDKWEKENEHKLKTRGVVRKVSNKNIELLSVFAKKNPDYANSESKTSDTYQKLMYQSMGGDGDDENIKEEKIISNISKMVTISRAPPPA